MDKTEALQLLEQTLTGYRDRTYAELQELIAEPEVREVVGPSGAKYQIEVQSFWDDGRGGNLRVLGAIDDGGWRAFSPLCSDFIMAPDGSFIGE